MILELGPFSPNDDNRIWHPTIKEYVARVVILRDEFERLELCEYDDFERLELCEYEKSDQLTPFIHWLHDEVGNPAFGGWRTGGGFSLEHNTITKEVYFASLAHATVFLFRWSA